MLDDAIHRTARAIAAGLWRAADLLRDGADVVHDVAWSASEPLNELGHRTIDAAIRWSDRR